MELNPAMMTTLIALLSLIVAAMSLARNRRGDEKGEAERMAKLDSKLDSIRSGVDDIRVEQRTMQRDVSSLAERMAHVESDVEMLKRRRDEE